MQLSSSASPGRMGKRGLFLQLSDLPPLLPLSPPQSCQLLSLKTRRRKRGAPGYQKRRRKKTNAIIIAMLIDRQTVEKMLSPFFRPKGLLPSLEVYARNEKGRSQRKKQTGQGKRGEKKRKNRIETSFFQHLSFIDSQRPPQCPCNTSNTRFARRRRVGSPPP